MDSAGKYRNDPKFSDRLFWAKSADPDQTAPIPFASFSRNINRFCLFV